MLALSLVGPASQAAAEPQTFQTDGNHTRIRFVAETALFDVDGWFDKYALNIKGDPEQLKDVDINVEIDAASINTQNAKRDEHLRSADFFDVAKYPKITFKSTKVTKKGKGGIVVEGDFTMHGVTKKIKFPFKAVKAKNAAGVEEYTYRGELTIDRNDYGVGTDSIAAKITLQDEVKIALVIAGFFK
ncbi:MAG: YceI family protein [Myxococcales bacterium]|nr:YceI family protein [Myxococcales bacterium]